MQVDGSAQQPTNSKRKAEKDDDDEEENGEDVEMLDVEFDFFDPQEHDYHSIKLLLSQLLSHDASSLDLGGVTNLILEQKLVGSTVKTDGAKGDPYAVLTVLNLNVHKENPAIAELVKYILSKASADSSLLAALTEILAVPVAESSASNPKHVGLVLSERLVNMPAQIVPPMYTMLAEELQWAKDDAEPYHFSHLLFLSRVFIASSDELEDDPNAALNDPEDDGRGKLGAGEKKRKKKAKKGEHISSKEKQEAQVWVYHAEDDFIATLSSHKTIFAYSSAPKKNEDGDSFGVETKGQIMLMEAVKFPQLLEGIEAFIGPLH
ncbi:hypothetical protein T439DRAFT_323503 [Meredithblackwellia eburnea MCA 4105]